MEGTMISSERPALYVRSPTQCFFADAQPGRIGSSDLRRTKLCFAARIIGPRLDSLSLDTHRRCDAFRSLRAMPRVRHSSCSTGSCPIERDTNHLRQIRPAIGFGEQEDAGIEPSVVHDRGLGIS